MLFRSGRVRRGYFVDGLSGAQFIRENDFSGAVLALSEPSEDIVWLSASDPFLPWGKYLPHLSDKNFMCVSGTAVALRAGVPIAVLEKNGKALRVFDDNSLGEALLQFVKNFSDKRVLHDSNKITIKEYPANAVDALKSAGFTPIMMDFVLYRGVR